jgi:hypothetical protein
MRAYYGRVEKTNIVYIIPGNILVMPVFQRKSHECQSGYIHIDTNRMKCPIKKCSSKPRYHYHVKADLMCIHILLSKILRNENNLQIPRLSRNVSSSPQFSKMKTAQYVVDNILSNMPSPLQEEIEQHFLQESLKTQQKIYITKNLDKYDVKFCKKCLTNNILRKKRLGNLSFLVTPGFMIEVHINTYLCKSCDIIFYPDLYNDGFVPVSENLLVSWSCLVDARNQMKNGAKLYKFFVSSLRRMCIENKQLASKINKIDFHNLSIRLSRCAVSYNSACLLQSNKDENLDCLAQVLCLHCGLVPITLMSDGNAKNSIFFRGQSENLVFDPSDESEIPSLNEFIKMCVISVTGSSLFQHFPKEKVNMLKIPPIISKNLICDPKNREYLKKSAFMEEFDLSVVDFAQLTRIVTSSDFDLLKSRKLNLKTLRQLAKKIRIPKYKKQSKIMLENIILELFDWVVGGNSNCHKYTHTIGETGGWTDSWCPHNVKYASKIMILQESVVDPADLYLSLLFPPLLQILDDACTFVSHLCCSEKELAEKLFGINRGCFEPPHESKKPRSDHDCPEILPLALNPREACENAFNNPETKVHPISRTLTRLVLGTKLTENHRTRNECLYHNVNNCIQSTQIKVPSNI